MIESTVATLSGIILWYSVKYFIIGEYIYFSNKAVSVVHIWKLIPSLLCTAVSIALAGWANATDTCAASLQRISLTVVAINCTAFGVTALSVNLPTLNHWSSVAGCTCSTKCTPMCPAYNRVSMAPVMVAITVAYLHASAAGARLYPDNACASIFTVVPLWVVAANIAVRLRS